MSYRPNYFVRDYEFSEYVPPYIERPEIRKPEPCPYELPWGPDPDDTDDDDDYYD